MSLPRVSSFVGDLNVLRSRCMAVRKTTLEKAVAVLRLLDGCDTLVNPPCDTQESQSGK